MIAYLLAAAAGQASSMPAFMAGCWNLVQGDHWTQECWMEPKADLMLGASREGSGEKLRSWEQLRIERDRDGGLTLYASPGGRSPLPFKAVVSSATRVEFTNPAHDYPQRIRYERKGPALEAEISLIDGSNPVRWTYVPERSPALR